MFQPTCVITIHFLFTPR